MKVLATFLLVLFGVSVQGLKYTVKVTLLTQDVHVGLNVSLGCNINPVPPEPSQYRWSSSQSDDEVWTVNDLEGGSTLLTTVRINSPYRVRYFCNAHVRSTFLASGSLLVQIKGQAKDAKISLSQSASLLQLEVVPAAFVLARLSWYHDGMAVDPRRDARLQLSNGSTFFSLVIREPSFADAGVYTARVSSLELTRDGPTTACGRTMANLLQCYAAVAPTEFTVSKTDILSSQSGASLELPPPQHQLYILHQHIYIVASLTLTDVGVIDPAQLGEVLETTWYHEGRKVFHSNTRYNQSVDVLPDGTLSATLIVTNGAVEDSGLYTVEACVRLEDMAALKLSVVEDCYGYVENLTQVMGLKRIILGSSEVNLILYEPPRVVLSTNQTALGKNEAAILSCSLVGGKEDKGGEGRTGKSTIRWLKGGKILSESLGTVSQLLTSQIKADLPMFGKYSCVIVDLYYAEEKSLILSEEANMEIQLKFVNKTSCTNWKDSDLKEIRIKFVDVVVSLMSRVAPSNITKDSIAHPSMSCQRGGAALVFKGDLVYANLKGDVTASSVLYQTMGILNGTVMLGSHLYQISVGDDIHDSSDDDLKFADTVDTDEWLWFGSLIAILVSCLVLGTIITMATVIICRRCNGCHSTKTQHGWILMDTMENQ